MNIIIMVIIINNSYLPTIIIVGTHLVHMPKHAIIFNYLMESQ